jgi:tRNA A37 methylthiotransferase MiaB
VQSDAGKRAVVLIESTGCPRNMLLKLRVEDYLQVNGWMLAPPDQLESCDLVALCTCGFVRQVQRDNLGAIRAVHECVDGLPDPPMFVVTGCLPSIRRRAVRETHNGPAFGPRQIDRFDDLIHAATSIADIPYRHTIQMGDRSRASISLPRRLGDLRALAELRRVGSTLKRQARNLYDRYLLHDPYGTRLPFDHYQMGDETWCVLISVGCLGNCSYCSIKFAKGRLTSRPLDVVVQEVRQGVQSGYKWVALIADDSGSYGADIGTGFGRLLVRLNEIEGDFSILIDSLNPRHFNEQYDHFTQVFLAGKMKRLCLGIQHVSSRILASMKRHYDMDLLKRHLSAMAATVPSFKVDAHFIVGYPGETEQEFRELVLFAEWLLQLNPLNSFKVFTFTANPGTAASRLDEQLPWSTIKDRRNRLRRLQRPTRLWRAHLATGGPSMGI